MPLPWSGRENISGRKNILCPLGSGLSLQDSLLSQAQQHSEDLQADCRQNYPGTYPLKPNQKTKGQPVSTHLQQKLTTSAKWNHMKLPVVLPILTYKEKGIFIWFNLI